MMKAGMGRATVPARFGLFGGQDAKQAIRFVIRSFANYGFRASICAILFFFWRGAVRQTTTMVFESQCTQTFFLEERGVLALLNFANRMFGWEIAWRSG